MIINNYTNLAVRQKTFLPVNKSNTNSKGSKFCHNFYNDEVTDVGREITGSDLDP